MEFVKKHLNDTAGMWINVLWSDETKIEVFGLNSKRYIWCKPITQLTPSLQSNMVVAASCYAVAFSSAGTGKLVRMEGMMDGAKYRRILDENLLESAMNLKLGMRFTFQQDNDPNHKNEATLEWLNKKKNSCS